MTIFFYKALTKNLEIVNSPLWVLSKIWRLGQVRDTKFDTNVSNESLMNAAKSQGYSVYRFRTIKRKSKGRNNYPPIQIRVKVGLSPPKKLFYLLQWKSFKSDEKCFS